MHAVICLGVRPRSLPQISGVSWLVEPQPARAGERAEIVVRWGTPHGPEALVREYNRGVALAGLSGREARLWALAEAGVPVEPGTPRRAYRVAIWDLEPCLLWVVRRPRRRSRRPVVPLDPEGSPLHRAVVQLACRALHALRLDFGVVELVARSRADVRVVDVNPAPDPGGPEGRALLQGLRWTLAGGDGTLFALGADLELQLYDRRRRRLVVASRFLERDGPLGLDNARVPGTDRRLIVEVRPAPSIDPDRLVVRIGRLLRRLARRVPARRLMWVAGSGVSRRFPIGGHVHFSGLRLNAALLRALDAYLAVPVLLLEDPDRARRRRARYGWPGDFRRKDWGFEYRTLPSWAVAPAYARAVLHLALLVARHWPRLTRDPFLDPRLHRAFRECVKDPFYELFPSLWQDLTLLPDYPERAPALAVLARRIGERKPWPERRDIRRAWGIR